MLLKNQERLTILLIPHTTKGIRAKNFSISFLLLKIIFVLTVCFSFIFVGITANFVSSYLNNIRIREAQEEALEEAKRKNKILEKEFETLVSKSEELREKLTKLEEMGVNLELLAGLIRKIERGKFRSSKNPRGGPIETYYTPSPPSQNLIQHWRNEFCQIQREILQKEQKLYQIKAFLDDKKPLLDATPFTWPLKRRITSAFGYRRSPFTGKREFHYGIDISAKVGTPIRATADGKVAFSGWKPGYGYVVILKHDYGYKTIYAHASRLLVKRGQRIKRGEIIAMVGNSGRSTGPHLHYEIRLNNRPINPIKCIFD